MASLPPAVPPLFSDQQERDRLDDLATFYSIIKATELLERSYMNDDVPDAEYTAECAKLIGKFKNMERTLIAGRLITSTEAFMAQYHLLECRKAAECLLTRGVPVTSLYRQAPLDISGSGAAIAETTSALITCLDGLNLGNHAVDEVQPALKDVLDTLNKVPLLPASFEGRSVLARWLEELNSRRAAETLDDGAVRQLVFDLNAVYASFLEWLKQKDKH